MDLPPRVHRLAPVVGAPGGRTSSSPRINIEPTILPKKIEDLREARAKAMPSVGAQAMRTLLGSGRPSARRDQLRPVSPDK